MTTTYGDKCPCCGVNVAEISNNKSLMENEISVLQDHLRQMTEQFLRLAKLNQQLLDQESARLGEKHGRA